MTGAAGAPAIRPATAADEMAIRACARAAYSGYVADIGKPPAPMTADYAAQVAAGQVHVAEADGAFLGFIAFYPAQGRMLLENVAVRPEAAGRGVGKALIAFCEARARQAGLAAVVLYTNAKMTANLTLYPHLGYVETGRRHEDGFDRVYFEKRLD